MCGIPIFLIFFKDWKGKVTETEGETETGSSIRWFTPPIGNKARGGLKKPGARSFFQLFKVATGPEKLGESLLFSQAIHRELDGKWSWHYRQRLSLLWHSTRHMEYSF